MSPLETAWQAVLERPGDDRALQVLSDALIENGDPHGELIALQLSPDTDRDEVDHFIARHASGLLGGDDSRLFTWSPVFEKGFIVKATGFFMPHELEVLLTIPVGRLVRELHVHFGAERLTAILSRGLANQLRTLWLRPESHPPPAPLQLKPLLAAVPKLERLVDTHDTVSFAGAQSEALKSADFLGVGAFHELGEARLPALRDLTLTLPFRRVDFDGAFLDAEVTPALESFRLFGALWPSQLESLSRSALLRRLRQLTLLTTTDTGWYPVLLQRAEAFSHVPDLRLRPDGHHPEWIEAVRAVLPNVTIVQSQLGTS
ncbi:MAG: hypothetical protein U0228_27485 [Myxococcaceae bacterium]